MIALCVVTQTPTLCEKAIRFARQHQTTRRVAYYVYANDCKIDIPDVTVVEAATNHGVVGPMNHLYRFSAADIVVFMHDDVEIYEEGWDQRILRRFYESPACAVIGFGGSKSYGGKSGTDWEPVRGPFLSNMRAAEKHGSRILDDTQVVVVDGFGFAVRRSLLDDLAGFTTWPFENHGYDAWICLEALNRGLEVWAVPIACEHYTKWPDPTTRSTEDQTVFKASLAEQRRRFTLPRELTPVYINNRNRLASTRALVADVRRMGGTPIIVDNASSFQPLLDWYDHAKPCEVVRMPINGGSQAPWLCGVIGEGYYVETDSDLDLSGCPDDTLEKLRAAFDKHKDVNKVGLSLRLDDLPAHSAAAVHKVEDRYWSKKQGDAYIADVDTTFALYHTARKARFLSALRLAPPYTARHLPWYVDPVNRSAEEQYYHDHAKSGLGFSFWRSRLDRPKVTVVIPTLTYQGAQRAHSVILALLRGSRPPDRAVVVDNGGHYSELPSEWTEAVEIHRPGKNLGVSASFNWAIDHFDGWIVFVNDDVEIEPTTLERFVKAAEETDKVVVTCEVPGGGFPFFLLKREAVDLVGKFDERFTPAYYEDTDYAHRLALAGQSPHRIVGGVKHGAGGTSAKEAGMNGLVEASLAKYIAKWGGPPGKERGVVATRLESPQLAAHARSGKKP